MLARRAGSNGQGCCTYCSAMLGGPAANVNAFLRKDRLITIEDRKIPLLLLPGSSVRLPLGGVVSQMPWLRSLFWGFHEALGAVSSQEALARLHGLFLREGESRGWHKGLRWVEQDGDVKKRR